MPIEGYEVPGAQLLQQQRCQSFASLTADRIRTDEKCLFSLLPSDELARLAAGWYEACSQAMLRGNFAPIDKWIRSQSATAAAEGFTLEDVLELLRICRDSAFETERWSQNVFSKVEEVINEAVRSTCGWPALSEEDWVALAPDGSELNPFSVPTEEPPGERRTFERNRLQIPIRIFSSGGKWKAEEITVTKSISRGGLYFVTQGNYLVDQIVKVSYPNWTDHGAVNREYSAKVVRLDRVADHTWGVAIHFLESLGRRSG
ncbi:MAG TPA: PilZ domain-containing protein [Candidatus Acidoferrales bacterium]|nr:PilZ domain-containing protein [Candidatus Acidoferrales bacterium]